MLQEKNLMKSSHTNIHHSIQYKNNISNENFV